MSAIDNETAGPVRVVRLTGDLTNETGPEVRRQLTEALLEEPPHLVLDLSGVDYFSGTGLALIVWAYKEARERGGGVKLLDSTRSVTKIIERVGLAEVFQCFEDEAEALASFRD